MTPDSSHIDVGLFYMLGLGLSAWLIAALVGLVRRLATQGLAGVWRSVRYVLLGCVFVAAVTSVVVGVGLGVAYGLGRLVHLLGWWPY